MRYSARKGARIQGAVFGTGRRVAPAKGAPWRWKRDAHAACAAGLLSGKQYLVACALADYLGDDGQCDPSYAALAEKAPCDERTVHRAIVALRDLGMLTWERRIVRVPDAVLGWRVMQTSNAYVLCFRNSPLPVSERHEGRGRVLESSTSFLTPPPVRNSLLGQPYTGRDVSIAELEGALLARLAARREAIPPP